MKKMTQKEVNQRCEEILNEGYPCDGLWFKNEEGELESMDHTLGEDSSQQIVDEIKKILTESDISAMEQIRNIFNKGL